MFHLVSEFGNAHKIVMTEKKRDELIVQGYREVEEKPKQTRKETKKSGDAE